MVDLSTRLLRSFLVVAEELNFTRAAARLHIAQQTLSSQISQLETVLGTPLFERTTRYVLLTAAGLALQAKSPGFLRGFDDLIEEVRGESGHPKYSVRLGFLAGAAGDFTGRLLSAALAAGIAVELHEYPLGDPSCGLNSGETDVAFVYVPLSLELEQVPLYTDPRVLAMSSSHEWASRDSVTLEEALSAPLIVGPRTDSKWTNFWILQDLRPPNMPAEIVASGDSLEGILAMVASGMGMLLTAGKAKTQVPRPGIAYVPISGAPEGQMVAASRKNDTRPSVRNFLDLVERTMREIGAVVEQNSLRAPTE